ncbi:peptidase [Longibacter salinarum]|uniref:Peptidase n=1 Tax=Longibacter salinarum TaxID=1850348 RepID=A0A2A8CY40_9BACT|nr:M1 family metallopeptidase [Longibacter salinarum]PEN13649.1 peptidase [Longibacter salinarum]
MHRLVPFVFVLLLLVAPAQAQQAAPSGSTSDEAAVETRRPIPYPIQPRPSFQRAVEKGTRTTDGTPGENYWTNYARYDLNAEITPSDSMLHGSGTITFINRSPDSLRTLALHLRQNVHAQGMERTRRAEITGGMTVENLAFDGQDMVELTSRADLRREGMGYVTDATRMRVILPQSVAPGDSVTLSTEWSFRVPGEDNFRMGQDGEVYYLAYWYPHLAVYDDVDGWVAELYQGDGEFYMGYADYELSVTVPEGWIVGATGKLQNPEEVLAEQTQSRLEQAANTSDIVNVVTEEDRGAGTATANATNEDGTLTWTFQADQVRDVAFGTSAKYVWDATSAETNEGSSMIHSMYRPGTSQWDRSAEFSQFSIEHLSDMLMPYPYPHMTAVEGIIGGGMEFPMITLIGGNRNSPESLFGVTYHEISHMWVPMIVGTNEKRHAWLDEGTTTFNENEGASEFFGTDNWVPSENWFYRFAGSAQEAPSMRHADLYPSDGPQRVYASYAKPGTMLHALRGVLGDETFFEAYREYVDRWAYKHPTPYDFFNTFEDVSGQELDWFWRGAFYEKWSLDHAIESVDTSGDQPTVTVEDRDNLVMPVILKATYADGETVTRKTDVTPWMNGERSVTITLPAGDLEKVELDPEAYLPDVDRTNNDWTK